MPLGGHLPLGRFLENPVEDSGGLGAALGAQRATAAQHAVERRHVGAAENLRRSAVVVVTRRMTDDPKPRRAKNRLASRSWAGTLLTIRSQPVRSAWAMAVASSWRPTPWRRASLTTKSWSMATSGASDSPNIRSVSTT